MIRKIFALFAVVAVLALGAVAMRALSGQDHGGMMGMMSMMKDCPMMGAMAQGPHIVLRHREALGLTDRQVRQLEELRGSAHPSHVQMMGRMQTLHQEIRSATEGERFDEAAVRAAFDRMGELHTEMGVTMLHARHRVRQVLTPEQREKLSKLGGGTVGMHGMMEHCPMMKGGMMRHHGHSGTQQEGA